ncbi:MAG: hypothetical protein ACW99A_24180 [Candidatus Kariarchaeaceae archaeon]
MKLEKEGDKYCILKIPNDNEPMSRPITEITHDNKTKFVEFDFVEIFSDKEKSIQRAKELDVFFYDID